MKVIITILCISFICCKSDEQKQNEKLEELRIRADVSKSIDSIMTDIGGGDFRKAEMLQDSCPIFIQSIKVYKPEYSYSKAFRIAYKNRGTKTIDAIKFMLYGENNWGEAEKISAFGTAYNYAEDQRILKPGRATSNSWTISTGDPTKMKGVVIKVHFTDGSIWSAE